MRRAAIAAALALPLGACGGGQLWMKPDATAADSEFDMRDCAATSEGGSTFTFDSGGGSGGPTMDKFASRYGCLRNRGYKLVSVTPEETAKLQSLSGDDKNAYWRELMIRHGIAPAGGSATPQ